MRIPYEYRKYACHQLSRPVVAKQRVENGECVLLLLRAFAGSALLLRLPDRPRNRNDVQITVSSGEAAVIERWGKFSRVADPGLHFLWCPCETRGGEISLRVQQLECVTISKTKDNVQLTVKVAPLPPRMGETNCLRASISLPGCSAIPSFERRSREWCAANAWAHATSFRMGRASHSITSIVI